MNYITKFHRNNIESWILLRLAAHEFYFKEPFNLSEEYPILKMGMTFAIMPIELIFVFLYARLYGSLAAYNLPLIVCAFTIAFCIANYLINRVKDAAFIHATIRRYEDMDEVARRGEYSFRNGFRATFCIAILPWLILGISLAVICWMIPH